MKTFQEGHLNHLLFNLASICKRIPQQKHTVRPFWRLHVSPSKGYLWHSGHRNAGTTQSVHYCSKGSLSMRSDSICHLQGNIKTVSLLHLSYPQNKPQCIRAEARKKWPPYPCKVVFLEPAGGSCLDSRKTGLWMSLTWIGGLWSPGFSHRCRLTHTGSTPTMGLCGSLLGSHIVQRRRNIVKTGTRHQWQRWGIQGGMGWKLRSLGRSRYWQTFSLKVLLLVK